jgi:hypothetical protein
MGFDRVKFVLLFLKFDHDGWTCCWDAEADKALIASEQTVKNSKIRDEFPLNIIMRGLISLILDNYKQNC